ncbi:helix-turn-helix transcriptional regulator [Streptomyces sp. JJ66]|uniref:helix-turn-helix domain-containing protein n=1 Tax=Streptomyces sp. JJ66 TaxID=2803843 RepID=UPI001C5791DE|nr:helix-turn-helix domain-containing protein [Streptomyces sp. JJ66]MBW1601415.1 helix-turn-helix transcriptional regulator [Streptomyces sp. JJ66]
MPAWVPLTRPQQEVSATPARRAQPRAWLRAVAWVAGAGVHPGVNGTTRRVAAELARRMDYTEGTVLYGLDGTAARLGLSRATVKRHVRVLREAGLLAWVRHGSRTNLRLPGRRYAGTATVYAATIPPGYDHALGHRLDGTGYGARVAGFTSAGRGLATAGRAPAADANTLARSGRSPAGEPQSRTRDPGVPKAVLGGRLNNTSSARRRRSPGPGQSRRPGAGRTPRQVARDIALARQVRPLVGWTQTEGLRRLAFALRPLIDAGLSAHDIAAELHAWYLTWRPRRPAAYIIARLRRRAARPGVPSADAVAPADSAAWTAYCRQQRAREVVRRMVAEAAPRTDADRHRARAAAMHDPHRVLDHAYRDLDDAIDLYSAPLVARYVGLAAAGVRLGAGG